FVLFFSRLHPRHSPLFPYTTLFRSALLEVALGDVISGAQRRIERFRLRQVRHQRREPPLATPPLQEQHGRRRQRISRLGVAARADRKSTRLNSSHVSISYAVFCLKK